MLLLSCDRNYKNYETIHVVQIYLKNELINSEQQDKKLFEQPVY